MLLCIRFNIKKYKQDNSADHQVNFKDYCTGNIFVFLTTSYAYDIQINYVNGNKFSLISATYFGYKYQHKKDQSLQNVINISRLLKNSPLVIPDACNPVAILYNRNYRQFVEFCCLRVFYRCFVRKIVPTRF